MRNPEPPTAAFREVQRPAGISSESEPGPANRAWAAALGLHAAGVPSQPYVYRPVRKQDYCGPNATRDPGPYRIRATAGFVRGVL